jgi:hypothetical protein
LIAIILAAAVTFLALGFTPTRSDRGELMRGLKVTLISLGAVAIILALTTINAVKQLNLEVKVTTLFENEIVTRVAKVVETSVQRNGRNSFIIRSTVIALSEEQLSPEEFATLEKLLSDAVGGPVEVELIIIPGVKEDLADADRVRRLELLFQEAMAEQNLQIQTMAVKYLPAGSFEIESTLVIFDNQQPTQADISRLQQYLSEEMGEPVAIHLITLPGTQLSVGAADLITKTTEMTDSNTTP